MATYTRSGVFQANGRLAAHMRHHPDADLSDLQRDLMEAKAGFYLQTLRDTYPDVHLTPEAVARLVEVLR